MPKSGKNLPWFRFYAGRWFTDTSHLTLEQQGAYMRLLSRQWLDGRVPLDTAGQAKVCGVTKGVYERRIWPAICEFFVRKGSGMVNRRLERERSAVDSDRVRRSNTAKSAARNRGGKFAKNKDVSRTYGEETTAVPPHKVPPRAVLEKEVEEEETLDPRQDQEQGQRQDLDLKSGKNGAFAPRPGTPSQETHDDEPRESGDPGGAVADRRRDVRLPVRLAVPGHAGGDPVETLLQAESDHQKRSALLGCWLAGNYPHERPDDAIVAKQYRVANRLVQRHDAETLGRMVFGIVRLYPHSAGEAWDLFDLEKKAAKALAAAQTGGSRDRTVDRNVEAIMTARLS